MDVSRLYQGLLQISEKKTNNSKEKQAKDMDHFIEEEIKTAKKRCSISLMTEKMQGKMKHCF